MAQTPSPIIAARPGRDGPVDSPLSSYPMKSHVGLALPPIPPLDVSVEGLRTEAVSGDGLAWILQVAKTLPPWIDDLSETLGDDIYERMSLDATVRGALHTLKAGVLEDGMQLSAAVDDEEEPDYAGSQTVLKFCEAVLEDLDPHMDVVLWDMLRAFHLGNALAEQVYHVDDIGSGPQLILKSLKVKPRNSYAFVTDPYANIVGIQALIPGLAFMLMPGMVVADPRDIPNLLPRGKFAILTIRMENNDPRGTSMLRAAYQAWWQKMQVWPEYLKYITQFGTPIVYGQPAPGALPGPVLDALGRPTGAVDSPTASMLRSLEAVRNGAAVVTPPGSVLEFRQAVGSGEVFLDAFSYYDRQITLAILNQTLATTEGEHNARAAALVHQDVLQTLVRQLKRQVCRMVRKDILQQMVLYNYGEYAARRLTPQVSLGETQNQNKAQLMQAYVGAGYQLHASQFPAIDKELDVPSRDLEAIEEEEGEEEAARHEQMDHELALKQAARQPQPVTGPRRPAQASASQKARAGGKAA